jgi:predicted alpha/beta hydrolase family esterase
MSKQIVIIHGSFGSSDENWFPWLARELKMLGYEAVAPGFPTPEGQTLKAWLDVFERVVGKLRPDIILVGHSLGVAFILRLLERTRQPIRGSFLVSGFLGELGLPEFDNVNAEFVNAPVDWKRVRENCGEVHVYNSDNDPYVPLGKGKEIARHLGVGLTVVGNGGHINASSGFSTFPLLLQDIKQCCQR